MKGHFLTTSLAAVAIVLLILASLLFLRKKNRFAGILWSTAWLVTISILVIAAVAAGDAPFASIWQVLTVLSACFAPLCLFLERRYQLIDIRFVFCLGSAIPLIGTLFMEKELIWQKAPALQSIWFVPHVLSYMIAYALTVTAFLFTFASLMRRSDSSFPFDSVVYAITRTSFPFFTFGMLSGAIWAEDAWGVYWSWDIKETWALITWMMLLLYFHLRSQPNLRKWTNTAQISIFVCLTVTFLGVSYLPQLAGGLHSYL